MNAAYAHSGEFSFFSDAQEQFDQLISQLSLADNENNEHGKRRGVFFEKGDDVVEPWIAEKAVNILNGQCAQVAKGLRISATKQATTTAEPTFSRLTVFINSIFEFDVVRQAECWSNFVKRAQCCRGYRNAVQNTLLYPL